MMEHSLAGADRWVPASFVLTIVKTVDWSLLDKNHINLQAISNTIPPQIPLLVFQRFWSHPKFFKWYILTFLIRFWNKKNEKTFHEAFWNENVEPISNICTSY